MFKKPDKPNDKNALANRVRQLADKADKPAVRPFDASPPPPLAPRSKKARGDRHSHFKQGVLIFDDRERMRVIIKDLSDTGARIEFFVRADLPEIVVLQEATLRINRRARVVWQRDGTAGLVFE